MTTKRSKTALSKSKCSYCINCGEKFIPKSGPGRTQLACSPTCSQRWRRQRGRAEEILLVRGVPARLWPEAFIYFWHHEGCSVHGWQPGERAVCSCSKRRLGGLQAVADAAGDNDWRDFNLKCARQADGWLMMRQFPKGWAPPNDRVKVAQQVRPHLRNDPLRGHKVWTKPRTYEWHDRDERPPDGELLKPNGEPLEKRYIHRRSSMTQHILRSHAGLTGDVIAGMTAAERRAVVAGFDDLGVHQRDDGEAKYAYAPNGKMPVWVEAEDRCNLKWVDDPELGRAAHLTQHPQSLPVSMADVVIVSMEGWAKMASMLAWVQDNGLPWSVLEFGSVTLWATAPQLDWFVEECRDKIVVFVFDGDAHEKDEVRDQAYLIEAFFRRSGIDAYAFTSPRGGLEHGRKAVDDHLGPIKRDGTRVHDRSLFDLERFARGPATSIYVGADWVPGEDWVPDAVANLARHAFTRKNTGAGDGEYRKPSLEKLAKFVMIGEPPPHSQPRKFIPLIPEDERCDVYRCSRARADSGRWCAAHRRELDYYGRAVARLNVLRGLGVLESRKPFAIKDEYGRHGWELASRQRITIAEKWRYIDVPTDTLDDLFDKLGVAMTHKQAEQIMREVRETKREVLETRQIIEERLPAPPQEERPPAEVITLYDWRRKVA